MSEVETILLVPDIEEHGRNCRRLPNSPVDAVFESILNGDVSKAETVQRRIGGTGSRRIGVVGSWGCRYTFGLGWLGCSYTFAL